MGTVSKKFGFIRATLAMWTGNLFAGRAGVVTDSTPGPVERWGWWDGSTWRFSARSGASETFSDVVLSNLTVNNLPRLDANKKTVASCFRDDGTTATCSRPLVVSGGKVTLAPAAAGYASLNIPTRSAPVASPNAGDMSNNGTQILIHRIGIISASYAGSDAAEVGPHLGVYGTSNGWIMQIGASNDLAFHFYNSGYSRKIQFSSAGGIGFYGIAAPSSRPAVTGSRGGNAALASLLTALSACGLITDSTTA